MIDHKEQQKQGAGAEGLSSNFKSLPKQAVTSEAPALLRAVNMLENKLKETNMLSHDLNAKQIGRYAETPDDSELYSELRYPKDTDTEVDYNGSVVDDFYGLIENLEIYNSRLSFSIRHLNSLV